MNLFPAPWTHEGRRRVALTILSGGGKFINMLREGSYEWRLQALLQKPARPLPYLPLPPEPPSR